MRVAMVCSPIVENVNNKFIPAYLDATKNSPHLGPYLLASVLENEGFDISIIDLVCLSKIEERDIEVMADHDVILFSANSTNWPTCLMLIGWVKDKYPNKIIILGGTHATLFGEYLIQKYPKINYIIRGEGEHSLPQLLNSMYQKNKLNGIPGLIYNKGAMTIANPISNLLSSSEMDLLPIPLFDQMPDNVYKILPVESSRGCPGSCTFCAIPYQKHWRPISPSAFANKIEALQPYLSKVEKKYFSIIDDCFTIDPKRVTDILKEIEHKGIDFQITYDARIKDFVDEKLVMELAPHSKGLLIGAESFLPETIRKIHKPIREDEIIKCAKNVEKCGISQDTVFSFIIGFPWETKEQIQENIKKISSLVFDYGIQAYIQWHTLVPGSKIWNSLADEGKVSPDDLDSIGFLSGEKCGNLSSMLPLDDKLDIYDTLTCVQRILALTTQRNLISFALPLYLYRNQSLTHEWIAAYEQKMRSR